MHPLPSRRSVRAGALAPGALAPMGALAGCARDAAGVRVALATGTPSGVYHRLGARAPVLVEDGA